MSTCEMDAVNGEGEACRWTHMLSVVVLSFFVIVSSRDESVSSSQGRHEQDMTWQKHTIPSSMVDQSNQQ